MAEGVGFEPTGHCCPLVFKTRSIGRSDNPPDDAARGIHRTASTLSDHPDDVLAAKVQSARRIAATPPS